MHQIHEITFLYQEGTGVILRFLCYIICYIFSLAMKIVVLTIEELESVAGESIVLVPQLKA
jgi:hypothetical protein